MVQKIAIFYVIQSHFCPFQLFLQLLLSQFQVIVSHCMIFHGSKKNYELQKNYGWIIILLYFPFLETPEFWWLYLKMFTCERGYFFSTFLCIHIAFRMIRILFTWHFVSLAATKGTAHSRVSKRNCVRFLMCHCVGIWKIWIAKKSQNLNSCRIDVARKNSTTKHFVHYDRCGKRSGRLFSYFSLAGGCRLFVKSNWMKNEASEAADEGEKSERSLNHNHNQIIAS